MASQVSSFTHAAKVSRGYRRLLVPVHDPAGAERATVAACKLAAERHAVVHALAVIEVPALLPLDAHMRDEEDDARRLLGLAQAVGDAYGVAVSGRRVRARDAATAILDAAESCEADLLVLGAARRRRASKQAPAFGSTVQHVLRRAGCRVLVVAPPL